MEEITEKTKISEETEETEEQKYRKSFICVCGSTGCTLLVLLITAAIYFSVIGIGYGMSYAIYHTTHNMTNGQCYIQDRHVCQSMMCYFNSNQLSGFFGGCIFSGLLCVLVLIFGPILALLIVCLIVCVIMLIGMLFCGIGLGLYECGKHLYYSGIYVVRIFLPTKPSTSYGAITSTEYTTDTSSNPVHFTSKTTNDSVSYEIESHNLESNDNMVPISFL